MDVDSLQVAAGFLGTAIVLGVMAYLVGVGELLSAFALLDTTGVVVITAAGLAWLGAWSLALGRVLRTLDVPISTVDAVLLYASAAFANNVTPFGQAGGEPFSALLISRATDTEYERGLAAIASVDSLNFVPSIALALLGLAYYVARFTVGDRIQFVIAVVVGLALGIPLLGYGLWRYRARVRAAVARVLHPVTAAVASVVPGLHAPDPATIRERVSNFYGAIGRVATGGGNLVLAMAYSTVGWLFLCLTLWLSLWTLGYQVPATIVIIVVPVSTIASIAPLPGGAGGVEAATVLLLVPTTGVSAATAGAAAIIYRVATYWLPTVLGGLAAAWLQGRTSA
jgi:hypothetical protein